MAASTATTKAATTAPRPMPSARTHAAPSTTQKDTANTTTENSSTPAFEARSPTTSVLASGTTWNDRRWTGGGAPLPANAAVSGAKPCAPLLLANAITLPSATRG